MDDLTIDDDGGLRLDLDSDLGRGGLDARVAGHPGHLALELGVILETDLGDLKAEVALPAAAPHAVAGELWQTALYAEPELTRT